MLVRKKLSEGLTTLLKKSRAMNLVEFMRRFPNEQMCRDHFRQYRKGFNSSQIELQTIK